MSQKEKEKGYFARYLKINAKKRPYLLNLSLFDGSLTLLMVGLIYSTQYIVQAIETQNQDMFLFWIYILCGIAVLRMVINICWKPFVFATRREVGQYLYESYMPQVIHSDSNTYEKIGTGKMIAIFSKGMNTRLDTNWTIFGDIVASSITFLAFIITIYTKDLRLFGYLMGAIALIFIRFSLTGKTAYIWRKKSKENWIDIQRLQVRRFMSKQEILQQDKLHDELSVRREINNEWYSNKKIEKFHQGIAFDGSNFIAYAIFIYIIYYSALQVFSGAYSYADFILISGLGTTFIKELAQVLRIYRTLVDKRIDIEKMFELIDSLKNGTDINKGSTYIYKNGDIQVKSLNFGYGKNNKSSGVFHNFSLFIPGGSKTALVGPSGSGKTTLVKLIAGYLRPDSGSIYIDGQKLPNGDGSDDHISLKSYYSHIGYLTQEPSVFDGTVRENLEYGVSSSLTTNPPSSSDFVVDATSLIREEPNDVLLSTDTRGILRDEEERAPGGEGKGPLVGNMGDEKLKDAITAASCEFLYNLPNGLDTQIGERGVRLSGGQRQRLAIAKIFLKDPKIIILDEPTSALDSESEEAVTQAMNRLFEGRTVLIIAHRLQTVKHADNIIYLDDGKIVEQGTHEELMSREDKYFRMVELQSGF